MASLPSCGGKKTTVENTWERVLRFTAREACANLGARVEGVDLARHSHDAVTNYADARTTHCIATQGGEPRQTASRGA